MHEIALKLSFSSRGNVFAQKPIGLSSHPRPSEITAQSELFEDARTVGAFTETKAGNKNEYWRDV